jgi:uncharacterized membrane protein
MKQRVKVNLAAVVLPWKPVTVRLAARGVAVAAAVLFPFVAHAILTHWQFVPPMARTGLIVMAALSHGMLYCGLSLLFGLSLRPGHEALVSRLARHVEPFPTPALLSYTRWVTWLWTSFFATQLIVSAVLLALAPLPVWSMFVNMLDAPLVVLTFAIEYAVRRWRFRRMPVASLIDTVRAFARREALIAAPSRYGTDR